MINMTVMLKREGGACTICFLLLLLFPAAAFSSSCSLQCHFRAPASKPEEKVNMFWNSLSVISSGNPTTKIVVTSSGDELFRLELVFACEDKDGLANVFPGKNREAGEDARGCRRMSDEAV